MHPDDAYNGIAFSQGNPTALRASLPYSDSEIGRFLAGSVHSSNAPTEDDKATGGNSTGFDDGMYRFLSPSWQFPRGRAAPATLMACARRQAPDRGTA